MLQVCSLIVKLAYKPEPGLGESNKLIKIMLEEKERYLRPMLISTEIIIIQRYKNNTRGLWESKDQKGREEV